METKLLLENLSNPALLFFFLGILAVSVKSDLSIPKNSSKFISLYLLLSIGFKGGQELAHSHFTSEIAWALIAGIVTASVIPIYLFFLLKRKIDVNNAGAIAASYGSVSAVTFVTCVSFLEMQNKAFDGYLVAVMALMEAPSIIVSFWLISKFNSDEEKQIKTSKNVVHALTNGSVLLIIGSLVIGLLASDAQAQGIKPFTTDLFKGFLAVFLLDMGITCGRRLSDLKKNGVFFFLLAMIIPLVNGSIMSCVSGLFISSEGNRLLMSVLAASASYIAVPAALRISVPKANPSIYIPMALGITFPINITIGFPIYETIIQHCNF
ncbi:MAG: sodium-dependent bicarbonate transport family permease [Fluviicola sp.]|nr:sodium-dependent bicarbonate transport family permease [Fluviicola sp.]